MLRQTGSVLVIVLVAVAAVAVFSGVLERVWPASQISPVTQQLLNPGQPVNTFPITTLGNIKDKKVQLEVQKATVGIIDSELSLREKASQIAYDKLVGSINSPGILGAVLLAGLTGIGTNLYKNKTMYNEQEVDKIKKEISEVTTA